MTGTVHNNPVEIQYILDLYRQGLKKSEIAFQCEQRWKHRKRTSNSINYIITKYKNDPDYSMNSAPPHTAPAMPSSISPPMGTPQLTSRPYPRVPYNTGGSNMQSHRPARYFVPNPQLDPYTGLGLYPNSSPRDCQASIDLPARLKLQQQLALSQIQYPTIMQSPHLEALSLGSTQRRSNPSMNPRHLSSSNGSQGYLQEQNPGLLAPSHRRSTVSIDPRILAGYHQAERRQQHRNLRPPPNHLSQRYNTTALGFSPNCSPDPNNHPALGTPSHLFQRSNHANMMGFSSNHPSTLNNSQTPALGSTHPLINASSPMMNQSVENSSQKITYTNPSSHQPHPAQISSNSKLPNVSSDLTSSEQDRVPEVTLWKKSTDGKDVVKHIHNAVFQEQLTLDGWNMALFRKVHPPPSSLVIELHSPLLLWNHPGGAFCGKARNQTEFLQYLPGNEEASSSFPADDDIDSLLQFESPRHFPTDDVDSLLQFESPRSAPTDDVDSLLQFERPRSASTDDIDSLLQFESPRPNPTGPEPAHAPSRRPMQQKLDHPANTNSSTSKEMTPPLTPHTPNVQQSNKRKLGDITDAETEEIESTKKAMVSASVGNEQAENQNGHQQAALSPLSTDASLSPVAQEKASPPRLPVNPWQLDPFSDEFIANVVRSEPSEKEDDLDLSLIEPDDEVWLRKLSEELGNPSWTPQQAYDEMCLMKNEKSE